MGMRDPTCGRLSSLVVHKGASDYPARTKENQEGRPAATEMQIRMGFGRFR